jgi:hypothetical protein
VTVEVTELEARNESVEAHLNGRLIVRASRVDNESYGYTERFVDGRRGTELQQHWMIYLPDVIAPVLHYFGTGAPAVVNGLADVIAKAALT